MEYSKISLNLIFAALNWRLENFSSVSCRSSIYQITLRSRSTFQNLESTTWLAKHGKGMLFSVEQAFVGRDEKRASLKTPAWEARVTPTTKITQHDFFIIQVYHLVNRILRRVCCYSNGESPCHPSFYKEQKPSHSQHVLGYKLNRGGYVGWSPVRGIFSI